MSTPQKPEDLTKEFLAQALEKEYGEEDAISVKSFQAKDAEVGVLSHVVFIDVHDDVHDDVHAVNQQKQTIQKFVAKFLKPQFPLQHMFQVESHFYRHVRPKITSFQVPRPIHTSNSMIMVEYVASDHSYTVVEACPSDRVVPVVTRLGQMHAQFLDYQDNQLACPAGIGSSATGMMKETQFPDMWHEFLQSIAPTINDKAVVDRVSEICRDLSTRRLSLIHDDIYNHPLQTLIHGDFHVANMLFDDKDNTVWLFDWAACGRAHPLIDLAFFAIVSLDIPVRKAKEEEMLQAYHNALAAETISLDDCRQLYRSCLLNQFLILVVYDHMARGLAQQAKKPEELTHHFNVVNARACHALVDNFDHDLLPRLKTKEEAAVKAEEGDVGL